MAGANFVSPTGYIDLDNDCQYSIDLKSTRSREYVDPKEDLAFYFNTYITPKYGLENLNVNNVASFMKDLQMNWTKLTPDLKDKVLNIMVDGIFKSDNYDFKNNLLAKIGIPLEEEPPLVYSNSVPSISTFGSKSNFGNSQNIMYIGAILVFIVLVVFLISNMKQKPSAFAKMF